MPLRFFFLLFFPTKNNSFFLLSQNKLGMVFKKRQKFFQGGKPKKSPQGLLGVRTPKGFTRVFQKLCFLQKRSFGVLFQGLWLSCNCCGSVLFCKLKKKKAFVSPEHHLKKKAFVLKKHQKQKQLRLGKEKTLRAWCSNTKPSGEPLKKNTKLLVLKKRR